MSLKALSPKSSLDGRGLEHDLRLCHIDPLACNERRPTHGAPPLWNHRADQQDRPTGVVVRHPQDRQSNLSLDDEGVWGMLITLADLQRK